MNLPFIRPFDVHQLKHLPVRRAHPEFLALRGAPLRFDGLDFQPLALPPQRSRALGVFEAGMTLNQGGHASTPISNYQLQPAIREPHSNPTSEASPTLNERKREATLASRPMSDWESSAFCTTAPSSRIDSRMKEPSTRQPAAIVA